MDSGLKQRLIGAAVLIALAVLFLPMLVQGPAPDSGVADVPLDMPGAPGGEFQTRDLPLVTPGAAPTGGAVGMAGPAPVDNPTPDAPAGDGRVATVDAGTANQTSPPPAVTGAPRAAAIPADAAQPGNPVAPAGGDAEVVAAQLPNAVAPPAAALPAPSKPTPDTLPAPAAAAAAKPPVVVAKATSPAPVAAPLPPSTGAGDYAVHFGAYGSAADAASIVAQLRGAQLVASSEAITLDGKPAWRVRIGPYRSRADAEAARQRAVRVRSDVVTRVITLDDAGIPASAVDRAPLRNAPVAAAMPAPPKPAAATTAPTPSATAAAPRAGTAVASGAAGVGYAVQVGAFGSPADATALRDRLRSGGFTAFTGTVQTDKGTLTTVRVGPTLDRAAAETLRAQVKSKSGVDGIVRQNP